MWAVAHHARRQHDAALRELDLSAPDDVGDGDDVLGVPAQGAAGSLLVVSAGAAGRRLRGYPLPFVEGLFDIFAQNREQLLYQHQVSLFLAVVGERRDLSQLLDQLVNVDDLEVVHLLPPPPSADAAPQQHQRDVQQHRNEPATASRQL